ncbi:MAG: AAA family ATPase [Flavobacteriales bacterium]|nr:AAA family ATPase [Flavobacteriales bacterium]
MKNPIRLLEEALTSLMDGVKGNSKPEIGNHFAIELEKAVKDCITFLASEKNIASGKIAASIDINQLFLADLVHISDVLHSKSSAKSVFILAYYYDALINNKYAETEHLEAWLSLTKEKTFSEKLEKTLSAYRKPDFVLTHQFTGDSAKLDQLLTHYSTFIRLAFGLNFKSDEEKKDFFKLNKAKTNHPTISPNDSLEKVMEELNELIGLDNVKKDINDLINLLKIQKIRTEKGLQNVEVSLHNVFLGPPGTGKTTVARLLGRIYKHLGYLTVGQCIETDREGLVAGYVGQTATKVNEVVQQSKGGVLFVDEAYALNQGVMGNDYGSEAVNTLLKRMEDLRTDMAVVVAGYTEPMKEFIESNPGLRSRFNRYIIFDHFSAKQMMEIFLLFCKKADFKPTSDAQEKLEAIWDGLYEKRDEGFGNARVVRNIFEQCIENQANRLSKFKRVSKERLMLLEEEDIPEPKQMIDEVFLTK